MWVVPIPEHAPDCAVQHTAFDIAKQPQIKAKKEEKEVKKEDKEDDGLRIAFRRRKSRHAGKVWRPRNFLPAARAVARNGPTLHQRSPLKGG